LISYTLVGIIAGCWWRGSVQIRAVAFLSLSDAHLADVGKHGVLHHCLTRSRQAAYVHRLSAGCPFWYSKTPSDKLLAFQSTDYQYK